MRYSKSAAMSLMTEPKTSERWVELEDYPGYAISDAGRVINTSSDMLKQPSRNQAGILIVNMIIDRRQTVRSVALLVANTFMWDIPRPPHFDTPIHLDGDKANCAVSNLMWRPRWFAVKYHKQFQPWERTNRHGLLSPVRLIETGEEFPTSWEAAITYGLLDFEIFLAIQNRTYVFPINQRFEEIIP